MVKGNCAVVGCTNGNYRLRKWKKDTCGRHASQSHQECPCVKPFWLHKFPSVLKNLEKRKEWIHLMLRTTKGKSAWTPGESEMVYSEHFVDGMPTDEHPNPSLRLGYEPPSKKARRALLRPEILPANQVNDRPFPVEKDNDEISTAG